MTCGLCLRARRKQTPPQHPLQDEFACKEEAQASDSPSRIDAPFSSIASPHTRAGEGGKTAKS